MTKLEYNWHFLVEFFATFAPIGVPTFSKFKAGKLVPDMIFHHSWALTPLFLLHLCSFVTHPARQCFTYVLCDMDSFHREPSKRLSRPVLSECVCTQYVDCFVFVDDVVKRCVLFSISIDINVQGWASLTAGHARGLAIHGLTLASRSEGSRHRCVDYIGVCKHGCNIYIYI